MGRKRKDHAINLEVSRLTYAYTFLLSAAVIFVISLKTFSFDIMGNDVSYAIFIVPFLYFLVELITKEIGFRPAKIAVLASTVVFYLSTLIVDMIFGFKFNLIGYLGITFAYFLSQFLNLFIYYYMLDNYKTPLIFVILNMVFCLLVNNMLYMIFSTGMVFTDNFCQTNAIALLCNFFTCVILGVVINFVKQGIDID